MNNINDSNVNEELKKLKDRIFTFVSDRTEHPKSWLLENFGGNIEGLLEHLDDHIDMLIWDAERSSRDYYD